MKHYSENISITTGGSVQLINITQAVTDVIKNSGVTNGMAFVRAPHTTAAITINEPCRRLVKDASDFLSSLVEGKKTRHDEMSADGRANGKAHLLSYLMSKSETVTVEKGKPRLGDFQAIYLTELDGPREKRTFEVSIMGE